MKSKITTKMTAAAVVFALTAVLAGCGDESEGPVQPQPIDLSSGETVESAGGEAGPEGGMVSGENQGGNSQGETGEGTEQQGTQGESSMGTQNTEPGQTEDGKLDFEDLAGWTFYFSSGAGAWFTELAIDSDGRIEGHYQDADMGDTGDTYPNGTLYLSDFTGNFGELEKVDSHTYKMKLSSLSYEQEPAKEEIVDGVRQIYSIANGLAGGEEFYLYLPGTRLDELPESYLGWVISYGLEKNGKEELPFFGLYNVTTGDGFSSNQYPEQSLAERIAMEISFAEESAEELEKKLQEATTQLDMNTISGELFQTWDDTLNIVWKLLEAELDSADMEKLRTEEREWITWKDAEVDAAGQRTAGGSAQSMDRYQKAAELTRERVYQLAEYAK